MAGWGIAALPYSINERILVDRQFKCLANMYVVKRLRQVVHGDVIDAQRWILAEVRAGPGLLIIGRRNTGDINLVGQVGFVAGLDSLVEDLVDLSELRLWSKVMRIAYKFDARCMIIALDHEWAGAALATVVRQVICEL